MLENMRKDTQIVDIGAVTSKAKQTLYAEDWFLLMLLYTDVSVKHLGL